MHALSDIRVTCTNPSKLRGAPSKPYDSMLDLLGSTPLLSAAPLVSMLPSLRDSPPEIMMKLENTNPGWSVKARPAMNMIEQAELRGEIRPGHTTLVESSSGNTAIAIAMVAAIKGYHFMPVVDIKMPKGKLDLLRIFGADVQQVGDPTIPPEEQRCPAPGPRTNPTHRVASSDLFIGRGCWAAVCVFCDARSPCAAWSS